MAHQEPPQPEYTTRLPAVGYKVLHVDDFNALRRIVMRNLKPGKKTDPPPPAPPLDELAAWVFKEVIRYDGSWLLSRSTNPTVSYFLLFRAGGEKVWTQWEYIALKMRGSDGKTEVWYRSKPGRQGRGTRLTLLPDDRVEQWDTALQAKAILPPDAAKTNLRETLFRICGAMGYTQSTSP